VKTLPYAINAEIEGFETIFTDEVLKQARSLRDDFPKIQRVIGADYATLEAIDAAYKTGSGIAVNGNIVCDSIYKMRKLDLALLIAQKDGSQQALHRAAYELAREAYTTGDIESGAELLALHANASVDECRYLIGDKLERMNSELKRRTKRLSVDYSEIYAEKPESPESIVEAIKAEDGKYLLNLPTAYGKTSKIIEPIIQDCFDHGLKVLVISHRRSINKNIAQIRGMVSYDECTHPDIIKNARGIKVVVNSLSAGKFKEFLKEVHTVIIDEASQVISHVLGGEVKERAKVWETLDFVVKNAPTAILADADINARVVELAGWDHRHFKLEKDHSDITVKTGGADQVRGMAIAAAEAGETVLIACDIAKEAMAIGKVIEKKTGMAPLVITADSAKWSEQAAFIADPNSTRHKVVIYSPVITSALSITSGHFKKHFGIFAGQVVPSDAVQMLRRDRTAREFTVGMRDPEYRRVEQVEVQFNGEMMATRELIESSAIEPEIKKMILEAIRKDTRSDFDEMRYEHLADEAWLRDHISNSLPATLISQGFTVELLEQDDDLASDGYSAKSSGRKTVKAETSEKLMNIKAASDAAVEAIKDAGSADEQQHLSVIRARAEKVLKKTILTEQDLMFWGEGEGEGKLKRFISINAIDSSNRAEQAVLPLIADAVSRMTETKTWTADDSAALFDKLNGFRSMVISLGYSISNATSQRAKQMAVTKLLAQAGLKTKCIDGGKSGDYYIITKESLDLMNGYIGTNKGQEITGTI